MDGKGDGLPETAANFGAGTFSAAPVSEAPVEIEVHDLVRKFGDFTAVAHTSFSVHRGEVFGLLGPNGAGKTTTFRMLCGLLPATSGRLSVAGVNLRTARIEARANVGYVAQKFSLYSSLSVYENLRFFGGAYGLSGHHLFERIEAVMAEFHLREVADQAAGSLPGGYKQRLSMAAALIHEPKILFLDEPTSGIAPLGAPHVLARDHGAFGARHDDHHHDALHGGGGVLRPVHDPGPRQDARARQPRRDPAAHAAAGCDDG